MKNTIYDLQYLRDISNGDGLFVNKMIGLFILHAPELAKEIKKAHSVNDFVRVNKTAHLLKSSINAMGILSLKKDIAEIESATPAEQSSMQFGVLLTRLNTVIDTVVNELKSLLN
jgi:HPt (histidine-containing phosphotransfer) domain-containing protein